MTCVATAVVRVTVPTAGADLDPSGYQLWMIKGVDSLYVGAVAPNGSAMLRGFTDGSYVLQVRDVAANCDVARSRSRTLDLANGDTVLVAFEVACAPATPLAYTNGAQGDIYVINSNGTGATRLTHTGGNQDPAWSPDGHRIAFTRKSGDGNADIIVMENDGFIVGQLTTTAGGNQQPAWSPDGSRIAF